MTIEISSEDHELLNRFVASGRFSSVADALHEALQTAVSEERPGEEYLTYLNEAIDEGLADADAGRTVSAEEFMAELRSHQRVPGVAA